MPTAINFSRPFGNLKPVAGPQKAEAYDAECYICTDLDFAKYGLPLCYACPKCGGHIAADDDECHACGRIVLDGDLG